VSGFEFKLDRLLRVRAVQEELAQNAWQAAEAHTRAELARLERIEQELVGARAYQESVQTSPHLDPGLVLTTRRSIELLEGHQRKARGRLEVARGRSEVARRAWQEARTALQGLQRLRAKARGHHVQEERRAEAKLADAVAMERDARRRSAAAEQERTTPEPSPKS